MPPFRTPLTATAAALLCVLLPPAPAGASPGPHWTARPAAGGRPYVYVEGPPGTVTEDTVSVTNEGGEPLAVRLRTAGASWITLARGRVTVPPRTRADVPFAVTVPDTVPGDHTARISVAASGRTTEVPVHLRVTGPTLAALTVEDVHVEGDLIHYALVNRGNTTLAPRLEVRAEGLTGTLVRRPARPLPVDLRPGQRVRLTERWVEPPAFGSVDITLRATARGGALGEATAHVRYVPRGAVVGAVLVIAAAAAARRVHHRRRAPRRSAEAAPSGTQRHTARAGVHQ
ncbi:hypothetical protein ACFXOS_14850 [Streptomyces sp. NPDC059175]|uniref:COG1470 family protein n=1 Tax=Streptomyces sp. NPDC059175 TaxID=3346757 RepID=UPI0036C0BC69